MRPALFCLLVSFVPSLSVRAERIVLVAGGNHEGSNVPALHTKLREPFGVGFDGADNMYIIEMVSGNQLLKIDRGAHVNPIAGQLAAGEWGDNGPAPAAQFNGPHTHAVLPGPDILVADTWNGRV